MPNPHPPCPTCRRRHRPRPCDLRPFIHGIGTLIAIHGPTPGQIAEALRLLAARLEGTE